MNTPQTPRAEALQLTAQIVKKTRMSFGKAQKQAWATLKLTAQMHQQPVSFYYHKEDGSTRFAIGFYGATSPERTPATSPETGLAIRYYDLLAQNWRSFRADRLIIN